MQLVAGVVQLLIFQHLALLMARAKSLNGASSLHSHASKCNDNSSSIMSQIHSLIINMHSEAKGRLETYANYHFRSADISKVCITKGNEFPEFSVTSTSSEEDKLSELYEVFQYMTTAIGNITQEEQRNLNPSNKNLYEQLNASKIEIAAISSNLFCVLNKRYKVPRVHMYYTITSLHAMSKKKRGCKVLKNYKHFLTQAADITRDWNKRDYTEDSFSDIQTPAHR
ncbi:leukemia inhibitory factor [Bufo bufo]|uniref:leukemia inhibitory factor n=1 Tax=Bufo bufo TaxID=8384 RepID=UPI001ABDA2BB|nr:leukemia inhibitory factor [Bufo bufo]